MLFWFMQINITGIRYTMCRKRTTPDINHTKHPPHQIFTTPDIHHTTHPPHQTSTPQTFTFGVVKVLFYTRCGGFLVSWLSSIFWGKRVKRLHFINLTFFLTSKKAIFSSYSSLFVNDAFYSF